MCREAVEIQEGWEPKPGDYVYNPYPSIRAKSQIDVLIRAFKEEDEFKFKRALLKEDGSYLGVTTVETELPLKKRFAWLPRQEDLQEILLNNPPYNLSCDPKANTNPHSLLFYFYNRYKSLVSIEMMNKRPNITAYWLCFVMDTLYNKQWNGETWEKMR